MDYRGCTSCNCDQKYHHRCCPDTNRPAPDGCNERLYRCWRLPNQYHHSQVPRLLELGHGQCLVRPPWIHQWSQLFPAHRECIVFEQKLRPRLGVVAGLLIQSCQTAQPKCGWRSRMICIWDQWSLGNQSLQIEFSQPVPSGFHKQTSRAHSSP